MTQALILAFDTSGPHCAVALSEGEQVLACVCESMKKGQAERLMDLLDETLSGQNLNFHDLSALAVGTGPGNFTGIRIGVSAARGLALGLGIPAYGITSFEQRAFLKPEAKIQSLPATQDRRYVSVDGHASVISADQWQEAWGQPPNTEPSLEALVQAIALLAAQRYPEPAPAPAPFYVRPADAAPSKTPGPTLLPTSP